MAIKHTSMREDFSRVNARQFSAIRDDQTIHMALDAIGGDFVELLLTDEDDGVWTLNTDVTIPSNVMLVIPMGVTLVGPGDLLILGGVQALRYPYHFGPGVVISTDAVLGLVTSHLIAGNAIVDKLDVKGRATVSGDLQVGPVVGSENLPPGQTYDFKHTLVLNDPLPTTDAARIAFYIEQDSSMTTNSMQQLQALLIHHFLHPNGFDLGGAVGGIIGLDSIVVVEGTGAGRVNGMHGIGVQVANNSTNIVTSARAISVYGPTGSSVLTPGTIENFYGLVLPSLGATAGTILAHGIDLSMTKRTGHYNLYESGDAANWFRGDVFIGTANAGAFTLTITGAGTAGKTGGGSWSDTSTALYKTDIDDVTGALARLLGLRGRTFRWTEPEHAAALPGIQVGFIAEEVQPIMPQWVGETEDGVKTLRIYGFEAWTVEALREMDTRLKALEQAA